MTEEQREKEQLQRCHVIEGMVQLLTNGLVLQLLSIQFIWRSAIDRKYRHRCEGQQQHNKPKARQRQMEAEGERRRQKTGQPFKDAEMLGRKNDAYLMSSFCWVSFEHLSLF